MPTTYRSPLGPIYLAFDARGEKLVRLSFVRSQQAEETAILSLKAPSIMLIKSWLYAYFSGKTPLIAGL